MQTQRIDLYKYFNIERKDGYAGYLNATIYSESNYYPTRKRPAIIVVAGGGYSEICEREGEPIAMAYLGNGCNAFTLEYSISPKTYPAQLIEGCMAIAYLKLNAQSLGIKENCVAICGFSAGGHLSAMTATMFNQQPVLDALKDKAVFARPDAVVLGYSVISNGEFKHTRSLDNISGGKEDIKQLLSLEDRVTKNSSPAFIWTTVNDDRVPCENSFLYALACRKNGVPFEFHAYEDGHHGLGLARKTTATPLGRVLGSTI